MCLQHVDVERAAGAERVKQVARWSVGREPQDAQRGGRVRGRGMRGNARGIWLSDVDVLFLLAYFP